MTIVTEWTPQSQAQDKVATSGGTSNLQAVRLPPGEWATWDLLFEDSVHGTVFASSRYLRPLAQILGREVSVYVVQKDGKPLAGIAVLGRRHLGASVVTPLPVTPYSAVLYNRSNFASSYPAKHTSEHLTMTRALLHALQPEFGSIDLSLCPEIDDVRPWVWSGWSASPSYTYMLDLSTELRMSHSVRKQARKAQEAGTKVSLEWSLDRCWAVVESTYDRQGVGIGLSRPDFLSLADELHRAGLAWMVTVSTAEGVPVASRIQLGVPGADTVYDWIAGSSPTGFSIGASPWNVIKVIEECRSRGYTRWNMCGANFEAIAKFKSEFGGDLLHGFSLHSPRPAIHSLAAKARLTASRLKRRMWRREAS